jgi:hypothetical protein
MISRVIRTLSGNLLQIHGVAVATHYNATFCRLSAVVACVCACGLSTTSLTAQGAPASGSNSLKPERARMDQTTVQQKPLQGEVSGSGQKAPILNGQAAGQMPSFSLQAQTAGVPTSVLQAQTAAIDHNPLSAQINRNVIPAKIDDFSFQDTLKKLNAKAAQAKKQPLSGSVQDQSSGFVMYVNKGAAGSPWFAFHPSVNSERQAAVKNTVPPNMPGLSK